MNGMKSCRCGARIPDDWPSCHSCRQWHRDDLYYGTNTDRLERYQMIRVKQKLDKFQVDPTWDEDTKEAVLHGLSNLANEDRLKRFRKRRRALQHIQVMWRNAQVHNLAVVDGEKNRT